MVKMLRVNGLMKSRELAGRDGLRKEVIEIIKNGASNGTCVYSSIRKRKKLLVVMLVNMTPKKGLWWKNQTAISGVKIMIQMKSGTKSGVKTIETVGNKNGVTSGKLIITPTRRKEKIGVSITTMIIL